MNVHVFAGATSVINETVGLTPTSAGCTSSLASTTCVLTLNLAPGSYAASITTYDGADGSGKILSTAQNVAFKVVAGSGNLVSLTLSGIPANILVYGAGPDAVYALAQDADQNFIVGAGAPVFTAAKTGGSTVATITQPAPRSPNRIVFAAAAPSVIGTETIGITASYPAGQTNACAEPGAVCALPSAVTASYGQTLFESNYVGSNVLGFTVPFASSSPVPAYTLTVKAALAMAIDPGDDLFVADFSTPGSLLEFEPPYTGPAVTNTHDVDSPYAMAIGSNGDVFVADTDDYLEIYSPPYTAVPQSIGFSLMTPYDVVVDANNTAYIASAVNKKVIEYPFPFANTLYAQSTTAQPYSLVLSGTTLYVGEQGAIDIFTLGANHSASLEATLTSGIDAVYGMALDANGNLFAGNFAGGAGAVGSITEFMPPFVTGNLPVATISESATGASTYNPWGLAFDHSGNLYVANEAGGENAGGINEYSPPFSNASTPAFALAGGAFSQPNVIVLTKTSSFSISP